MTTSQATLSVLLLALLALFATDRLRIELVALCGLAAALALGLVPAWSAFSGFSNPAVITVAELLILTRLLSQSHLMRGITAYFTRFATSTRAVIALSCVPAALTSVFINNIGALALWLPVALGLCASTGVNPRKVLMPLSFATLLGGTCSLIGTPANLVVSSFKFNASGTPLGFFELAWAALPMTAAGLLWLLFAAPLTFRNGRTEAERLRRRASRQFFTELRIAPGSPLIGRAAESLAEALGGELHGQFRHGRRLFGRDADTRLQAGDVLFLEADADAIAEHNRLGETEFAIPAMQSADLAESSVEAVVLPQSVVLGSSAATIEAFETRDIQIVALSSRLQRPEGRFADLQLRSGDVLLLRGAPDAIEAALEDIDCLALTSSNFDQPRPVRQGWIVLLAFAAAVAASAANLLSPELAFGAAVLVLALTGYADLRLLITELNWPILLMLAAMIPIGDAVYNTGLATVLAAHLVDLVGIAHPTLLLGALFVAAAVVTAFVNNVSAAAAFAPIAAAIAERAGLSATPFFIAVAIAVSLDFLTPFGHHNNALVMGIGDYSFMDFGRLGLPLIAVTSAVAIAAIRLFFG